ncbi:hypothetical protein ACF0H5_003441 [Mactra antiquata]
MATTHGLSVLTNSSVKPPLNPKTGLSTTLHERPCPTFGRFSGVYFDDYDHEGQAEREIFDPKSTSRKFASTADHATLLKLGSLSDEEFYQKLLELKNEQRKILQKCEKVYIEKHVGAIEPTFPDDDILTGKLPPGLRTSQSNDQTYRSETLVDNDGVLTCTRSRSPLAPEKCTSPDFFEKDGILTKDETQESMLRDSVTESMSKPPTGRPPVPYTAKSLTMPSRSSPAQREIARSLDDLREAALGLRKSFDDSDGEYIPDDTVSEPYRDQEKSYSRIEHMWNNFTIRDYAPCKRLERPSSATITRKEKKEKRDSWRHRLTVPEPFSMTMREEKKERKKSKNMEEFEEMMYKKQLEEEEELKKQFKARPVPAHVYLPLYDEIQEKSEERRRSVRQSCAEMLKSQEKPFSFLKREEDRKKHQMMDRECNQKSEVKVNASPETFKAKPVPKKIFDPSVDDKLMEEEEYRKIRIKMRSEELLRAAALPPNMQAREQMKEQKEREQKLKSKRKSRSTKSASRPRINHDVPNYDALYRQFQKELQKRKGMRESTVTEPFRLETQRTSKTAQERMRKEIEREEELLKENRWPYKLPRSKVKLGQMYSSLDSLPIKSTRSADARTTKTRSQLKDLSAREIREIEEERHRRVKEMKLRREIQERTKSFETPRENPAEKKRKHREATRARMEEYEKELQEMKERVNRRPLLIEQESQINAKNKAEKKFNATLRSVGLDEDFVHSRGSRSASVHDPTDDYDDDDFEDTAMKYHEETYTKDADYDRSMSPVES